MNASGTKAGWLVNQMGPYGVNALRNDILTGYSAALNSNNLIVENIMMNDVRNGSDYRCVIISQNTSVQHILRESDPTLLYVAGEYQYVTIDYIYTYPGLRTELVNTNQHIHSALYLNIRYFVSRRHIYYS